MVELAATDRVARHGVEDPPDIRARNSRQDTKNLSRGPVGAGAHRETASRNMRPPAVARPIRHCAMTVLPSQNGIRSKSSGNRLGMLASFRSAAEARTHECPAQFRLGRLDDR